MRILLRYPLWARIYGALTLGALSGINKSLERDAQFQDKNDLKFLPIINEGSVSQEAQNEALKTMLKSTPAIIQQAFKDANFKGPVHVVIGADPMAMQADSAFNANCTSFYDAQGKHSAYVVVHSFPTKVDEYAKYARELYAVGGHEAMHVMHRHSILRDVFTGAVIGFAPIFGIVFLNALTHNLMRLCEVDADLSSAVKLGTAKDLLAVFKKPSQVDKDNHHDETHPDLAFRVKYLSLFHKYQPKQPGQFINSELYQQIAKRKA